MVEGRTDLMRLANMTDDDNLRFQRCCNKFADQVTFYRELEYYSVTFTDEQWMLAILAEPDITRYLKVQ